MKGGGLDADVGEQMLGLSEDVGEHTDDAPSDRELAEDSLDGGPCFCLGAARDLLRLEGLGSGRIPIAANVFS